MDDFSLEKVGDSGEADVRMRPHIHAGAKPKFSWAHLIKEDKRPHHLTLR